MSLKEAKGRRSGFLSFRDFKLIHASSRGGGNVGIAPEELSSPMHSASDFQGLWKGRETALSFSGLSINRHFLRPVLRAAAYALSRSVSNSFAFACCMRRAASVSLRAAATLFSALMLSPSRRYCAGFSNNDRVSSGV